MKAEKTASAPGGCSSDIAGTQWKIHAPPTQRVKPRSPDTYDRDTKAIDCRIGFTASNRKGLV
jgi:hypothetical protein